MKGVCSISCLTIHIRSDHYYSFGQVPNKLLFGKVPNKLLFGKVPNKLLFNQVLIKLLFDLVPNRSKLLFGQVSNKLLFYLVPNTWPSIQINYYSAKYPINYYSIWYPINYYLAKYPINYCSVAICRNVARNNFEIFLWFRAYTCTCTLRYF